MDNKLYSLLNWSIGNAMPPTQLQLHLTNKCNLNCVFCPTKSMYANLSKDELSPEKWKSLIDEAISFGIKEFHICGGGEPFFYKDLAIELIKIIKDNRYYGEVITNGTLFNEKDIKQIINLGWDKVTFSVNSSDENIDNSLRGKGAFKKTIKSIKLFSRHKKVLKKTKPILAIHVVLCNKNYKDISNIIKLASKLGCKEVFFNSMNVWSKKCEDYQLNEEQIKVMRDEIKDVEMLAEKLKIDTNLAQIEDFGAFSGSKKIERIYRNKKGKGFSVVPCFSPWFNISVFPHGDASPCFLYKGDFENVKDKSLRQIWNSKTFNDIRKAFLQNMENEGCKNCNDYNIINNQKLKKDITFFSDLKKLWDKTREYEKVIDSKNVDISERERQTHLVTKRLTSKIDNLYLKINALDSKINALDSKISSLNKTNVGLKGKKTELNSILKGVQKGLQEEKNRALFFSMELSKLYNSKGYKYVLGPLDKVYSSIKPRKSKKSIKKKRNKNG